MVSEHEDEPEELMAWQAGFGRRDITVWEPEMAMKGWGRMDNRIVGVHTPLHARAMAVRGADGSTFVYVLLELLASTLAVRAAVLEQVVDLGLDEHSVMITATHTHSGPSGFSHYFFLNLNGPGFSRTVFDAIVQGAVGAIRDAVSTLQPVSLKWAVGQMPLLEPVAFNRSWQAYNLNPDVEPVSKDRRDEALDRQMSVLVAEDEHGVARGCVAWFPVHCTSVHAENDHLHGDNKGVAALRLEEHFGADFVALCAQEASGDVSPNFRYDRSRGKVVGRYDDDWRSAEYHGKAQAALTRQLIEIAEPLADGPVRAAIHYVDFSTIRVASQHTNGEGGVRTPQATLGLSMAEGTDEGPGPLLKARPLTRRLARWRAWRTGGDPKIPMLDLGLGLDGKFLGFDLRNMRVPRIDDTIRYVRDVIERDAIGPHPWIPQTLPLQLVRIGNVAIAGVPFEMTTVGGRRMRAHLRAVLDVDDVLVNSYANAYAGYCVTPQEYQLQHYEASYTLWGRHQLGATLTIFDWIVDRFPDVPVGAQPPQFDEAELQLRGFEPWRVPRARRPW